MTGSGRRATPPYDLFVSYARQDWAHVRPIVEALTAKGLRLFIDTESVEEHERINARLREGLAHSRALLAYYSRTYPTRFSCQRELTAAFLATEGAGEVAERILVVNPEPAVDHIEPVQLRDSRPAAPTDKARRDRWAREVAERLNGLVGTLGERGRLAETDALVRPRWWPARPIIGPRVGRFPELWRLHSALHAQEFPFTEPPGSVGLAVVYGLGGIGKTTLVQLYAREFATRFPGGVVWLSTSGGDQTEHRTLEDLLVEYRRQLHAVAGWLGSGDQAASPERLTAVLAGMLDERGQPCLWVIDDVPAGLPESAVQQLLVPSPHVRTVLTSRDGRYASLGEPLLLHGLGQAESLTLLEGGYSPAEPAEVSAAAELVDELGGHPFALEMAGSALRDGRGLRSVAAYRARVGPQPLAVVTDALRELSEPAAGLLTLTAALAPAPIPLSLLAAGFGARYGLTGDERTDGLTAALRQVTERCLATRLPDAVSVHPLVRLALAERVDLASSAAVAAALMELTGEPAPDPNLTVHVRHVLDRDGTADDAVIALLTWLFPDRPGRRRAPRGGADRSAVTGAAAPPARPGRTSDCGGRHRDCPRLNRSWGIC